MAKGNKSKGKGQGQGKDSVKDEKSKTTSTKKAQSINVRHILCEKHSKKEEALNRLRAGEAFDVVARDMSEDKARQGGSLGWKSRGSLVGEFDVAYDTLQVSDVKHPAWIEVKSSFGYHIVMIEGRK